MKKTIPLLIAVIIFLGFVCGLSIRNDRVIKHNKTKMFYYNTDTRNSCLKAMDEIVDDNSILLFGSSELSASDDVGYPTALFNNGNSNYNVIMDGRGYMQSLHHAISVGALANGIENNKVVLILSPQWFTNWSLSGEAYASRFSERLYSSMIRNDELSYETKRKITNRVEELLKDSDADEYKRVLLYDKVYVEKKGTIGDICQVKAWDTLTDNKQKQDLVEELSKIELEFEKEKVISNEVDFGKLLDQAEQTGKEACTNNEWYIYDSYFTTYVEESLESSKNSNVGASYLESPEYADLELFFTVCEELNIDPLIVSIPVNGIWYDWTGFPKDNRDAYYQQIREICMAHNVSLLDFSEKEYEKYFLKDIMHLGWKGWVYLNEGVYRFYLSDRDKVRYPFPLSIYIKQKNGDVEYQLANYISDVKDAAITVGTEKVHLHIGPDGYLIGNGRENDSQPESVSLQADGVCGAGIIANAKTIICKEVFDSNSWESSGVKIVDNSCTMITRTEGNQFNAVVLQVYDSEMNLVGNINTSYEVGNVEGIYTNNLKEGEYIFQIKGNSNLADESFSNKIFLKNGDKVIYSYSVETLTSGSVIINDIDFWYTY